MSNDTDPSAHTPPPHAPEESLSSPLKPLLWLGAALALIVLVGYLTG